MITEGQFEEWKKRLKEMKGVEHDGSFISIGNIRRFIDNLSIKEEKK